MITDGLLNAILISLSQRLNAIFSDIPIFAEFVPQELPDKCFFIDFAGNVNVRQELGTRYCCSGKLDISFYINKMSESARAEYNRIFCKISEEMKYISADSFKIRLDRFEKNVTDDILHTICNFNIKYTEIEATEIIGRVEQKYEAK